jgi:AmmeMemoRadiSam system protein B
MPDPKARTNTVRPPAAAGTFYPADASACRALAEAYVKKSPGIAASAGAEKKWIGGIVPHAGWAYSGAIAGQTIAEIARSYSGMVDVVVVFGAIHTRALIEVAAFDSHSHWDVPSGASEVNQELERRLIESAASYFCTDERFHSHEHAVEVEVPLIQVAWPSATILPIEVPVLQNAKAIGIATAKQLASSGLSAIYLASSDLTHYGPAYEFMPAGLGPVALGWARDNDRRLLHLVTDLAVDRIVPEVRQHLNACGGGAIAAMLAACREQGASGGEVLRHANSSETAPEGTRRDQANAVGYAAVVIG